WARVPDFATIGYGVDRLGSWILDGKLLDNGRPPVLTALAVLAIIVLFARLRSPAARAALALFVAVLALSILGHEIAIASALGRRIAEMFSPVRILSFVAVASAVAIAVALDAVADFAAAKRGRDLERGAALAPVVLMIAA